MIHSCYEITSFTHNGNHILKTYRVTRIYFASICWIQTRYGIPKDGISNTTPRISNNIIYLGPEGTIVKEGVSEGLDMRRGLITIIPDSSNYWATEYDITIGEDNKIKAHHLILLLQIITS